jgi:DoxX-like family
MNTVLWIVQLLWGVFFRVTGIGKICCYNSALWNETLPQVPWFSAVPQDLFVFIANGEFLAGVGLMLPAMTGSRLKLTPFAALGLTLVMILAAAFHIVRGQYNFHPSIF